MPVSSVVGVEEGGGSVGGGGRKEVEKSERSEESEGKEKSTLRRGGFGSRRGGLVGLREGRERSVFFHAGRRNDLGAQEGKSAVGTKNKGGFEKKEISSALPVC